MQIVSIAANVLLRHEDDNCRWTGTYATIPWLFCQFCHSHTFNCSNSLALYDFVCVNRLQENISMALTAVTPLLTHWSYGSLTLSHRFNPPQMKPGRPRPNAYLVVFTMLAESHRFYWLELFYFHLSSRSCLCLLSKQKIIHVLTSGKCFMSSGLASHVDRNTQIATLSLR